MELRQLKYFLTISEEKSFVRASKRLYISQQALSKTIQNLEKELHVILLSRNSGGVELTPQGMVLAKYAQQICDIVDLTCKELNATNGDGKKKVFFGIPYSILDLFNLEEIFRFQNINPSCEIHISEEPDKIVMNDIYYNYLDMGIVGGKSDFSNIDEHKIDESKTYIAFHKDNEIALKSDGHVCLSDLKNEVFITATKDYNCYEAFLRACSEAAFTPKIGQQSGNIDIIKQFIKMNQGIYPCPENRTKFIDDPDITLLELYDAPPIYEIFLITRKDKKRSKIVQEFYDYILKITDGSKAKAWRF